jgi:hypothetical protein
MATSLRQSLRVLYSIGVLVFATTGVRAVDQPSSTVQPRFAFIYLNDKDSASSFKELLKENDLGTDLVTLDDVPTTDFDKYATVIIGSDIEKAWSTSAANLVRDTKKPVLGLGEGGYYFFGKLHLAIGSPHGWHGGNVAVKPMRQNASSFWSTSGLNVPANEELVLYAETGHVGLHLPEPASRVVPIGQELISNAHYPIAEQDRHYVLWGFTGSPKHMTTLGKQLFVHSCRYVAIAEDAQVEVAKKNTDSSQLVQIVEQIPAAKSSSPKLSIFAPRYDREMLKRLENSFAEENLSFSVTFVDSLSNTLGDDSAVLVIVMDKESFLDVGDYSQEDLKHRKIIGIGYGAAKLFGELGLRINGGACAHGVIGPPRITVQENQLLKKNEFESPIFIFDPPILDGDRFHNKTFFGVYVGDKKPIRRDLLDVIALQTKDTNYAPIIRQGNHVLVCTDAPADKWSADLQRLIREITLALNGFDAKAATETVAARIPSPATKSLSDDVQKDQQATLLHRVQQLEERVARLESPTVENSAIGRARAANISFAGDWVNIASTNPGITRVSIHQSNEGKWSIRAWGACHPTDCDWGSTSLHLLGDTVAARKFPYGFATWDHGFTDVYFTLRIENDELVIESYDIFKDNSGRSNYRRVDRFRRETSPSETSREDVSTAASGRQRYPTTPAAPTQSPKRVSRADEVASKVRPLCSANSHVGNESLAVYFTYGPVDGARTLVQSNWDGTVCSSIELPYSISGLAADDGRLLAINGGSRTGQGRVIAIGKSGEIKTIYRDKNILPDASKIWSNAGSDEFLVSDNGADVVVEVSKDGSRPAEVRIRLTDRPNYQSSSVAKCSDGSVLYSDSDEDGVFRVPAGSGPTLGEPLLRGMAAVAARPGSTTWVAALEERLHVFEGDRQVTELPYPEGMVMFRPNIDFASNGTLVLAFHGGNRQYFYAVDLDKKQFTGLFTVDVNRLTSLAIAPKMEWSGGDAVHFESVE